MPDILLAPAILCTAMLLATSAHLGIYNCSVSFIILLFAMVSHNSNIPIIILVSIISICIFGLRHRNVRILGGNTFLVATAVVIALFAKTLYSEAYFLDAGIAQTSPPFLMARILADGPGRKYLDANCPAGVMPAMCFFKDRDLTDSDAILWDGDPDNGVFAVSNPSIRREMIKNEPAFVLMSFLIAPITAIRAAGSNWWHLLTSTYLDVQIQKMCKSEEKRDEDPALITLLYNNNLSCRTNQAKAINIRYLNFWHQIVTAFSIFFIFAIYAMKTPGIVRKSLDKSDIDVINVSVILLMSVLINAFVCGIVSGPFARYQARVIWLVPFAAVLLAMMMIRRRRRAVALKVVGRQSDHSD